MKRLIYTAVFGNYDRVYPPVRRQDADHIIVTDRADVAVPGWTTMVVDVSRFATPKAANLHYRALMHRAASGYDTSLYLDGNLRLLCEPIALFEEFERSGAALGAYAHPQRSTVAEEARAVIALGKVRDTGRVKAEVDSYFADGFPDDVPLLWAGVVLKDHRSPKLDGAMELWSTLYQRHLTRDQLSLPYIVWKTGLPFHVLDERSRKKDRFFGWYPHHGAEDAHPRYNHVVARSYDSARYRILLKLWRGSWQMRRASRQVRRRILGRSGT